MTIEIMGLIIAILSFILAIINTFFTVRKKEISQRALVILWVICIVLICFGVILLTSDPKPLDPEPTAATFFSDVEVGSWCYDAVEYLYNRSLIVGIDGNRFAPGDPAKRSMVITILYRLEGEPTVENATVFNDTQGDQYYSKAVSWAADNGIVMGDNGDFYPDEPITREEIASFLYRYHVEYKERQAANTGRELDKFSDGGTVSEYAASSVAWAIQNGLFLDIIDDAVMPGCTVTRAEAAVIFMRYCESVDKTS